MITSSSKDARFLINYSFPKPVHLCPSPLNPLSGHLHVQLPIVSVQVAQDEHVWLPSEHSLISVKTYGYIKVQIQLKLLIKGFLKSFATKMAAQKNFTNKIMSCKTLSNIIKYFFSIFLKNIGEYNKGCFIVLT